MVDVFVSICASLFFRILTVNDAPEKFIVALRDAIAKGTFVKLSLGNYKGAEPHLQKVLVRLIETKKGTRLFVQSKYTQRDIVKNYPVDQGIEHIAGSLKTGFRNGHLFTSENDLQLDIGKRSSRLNIGRPTFTKTDDEQHDRAKHYLVDQNAYYLKALGITTDSGQVRASSRDKWKQINKFVEVLDGLFRGSKLAEKTAISIVDMGSGKGYLTFAAYDHFANTLGKNVTMTGIDTRTDLIEKCGGIAEAGEYEGLSFIASSIAETQIETADILIALHACDTATDDALFKGIQAGAEIIVAAPCCHREIRSQLKPPETLKGILKHPVLLERTAESITDGLRSLLLESAGYATKMFEFVPTEHTPKNNMLVAVKHERISDISSINDQIARIMHDFGIESQRLGHLTSSAKSER